MLVLCISTYACTKVVVGEQFFSSIAKQGNIVTVSTVTSSTSVFTLENPVYVDNFVPKSDTISAQAFKKVLENEVRTKMISRSDAYTSYENLNFSIVGKMYEIKIYLPYVSQNGLVERMETTFAFIREIPMLYNMDTYYPCIHIKASFEELKQDLSYREPYSELTYRFDVSLMEEDIAVGNFSFTRRFAIENNPIIFVPEIEGWEEENGSVSM